MRKNLIAAFVLLMLIFVLPACGGSDDSGEGEGEGEGDLECESGMPLVSVSGRTIDADGQPVAQALVSLCITPVGGSPLCLTPVSSGDDGSYTVSANRCVEKASIRFLVPEEPVTHSIMACPVPLAGGAEVDMGDAARLVAVPEVQRETLGDESQPHTVTAADGSRLIVIPDQIRAMESDPYNAIRILVWDVESWGWPCFVDPANPPEALLAILPEAEMKSSASAHLKMPNVSGLAADSAVDFYVLGGVATPLFDGEYLDEGVWAPVSSGAVSSDGATVSSEGGEGLPFFTWAGYKAVAR